jgi:hypothetical protein
MLFYGSSTIVVYYSLNQIITCIFFKNVNFTLASFLYVKKIGLACDLLGR